MNPTTPPRHADLIARLAPHRPLLVEQQILDVTLPYYGYGDEGATEPPQARTADHRRPRIPRATSSAIAEALEGILEDHFSGYEVNEGAHGNVTWKLGDSPAEDAIVVEHNEHYTAYRERTLTVAGDGAATMAGPAPEAAPGEARPEA